MKPTFFKLSLTFALLWLISLGLLYIWFIDSSRHNCANASSPQFTSSQAASLDEKLQSISHSLEILKHSVQTLWKAQKKTTPQYEQEPAGNHTELRAPQRQHEHAPSEAYERTRHLMETVLNELWYNMRAQAHILNNSDYSRMQEIYRILRGRLVKLRATDGFESFRQRETAALSSLIQRRLQILQNPTNCDGAKKLACTFKRGCGFGCQVHNLCHCLITAYATGRMAVLNSQTLLYKTEWEEVFLLFSATCNGTIDSAPALWTGDNGAKEIPILGFPPVDNLKQVTKFLPVSIPAEIALRLERVHGEPHIWWVGQFIKYLLRLQPKYYHLIRRHMKTLQIGRKTVGIHVRRTDKLIAEAKSHTLAEYMTHAEEYFSILESAGTPTKRRVFIASDDPNVVLEARTTYGKKGGWEILADHSVARVGGDLKARYTSYGLEGILKDVFALAACDFLVCTFSSQVCRLAYELLQARHPDASQRFVSLDDVYYNGGGNGMRQIAVLPNAPRNSEEIALRVGDELSLAGNHWNGWSKGKNLRTNKVGLYPSYKAQNNIQKVDFPTFQWWLNASAFTS